MPEARPLYGIVDAGITYRSNERVGTAGNYTGHSNVGLTTGNLSGSRWGIKGMEDLGGGLRALFVLENGFDIANGTSGQGGRQFGRQAFVGVGSDRYGTVSLGRQYTSLDDFVSPVGPSTYIGGFGAHPGDIDDLDQTARVDSSIKYTSANYAGFTFGALYGFGGQPGSMKQRNTWSVGVGYERADNSKTGANDKTVGKWQSTDDGLFNSSINEGYASAQSQQVIATGATYDFGPALVGVNYSNVQYRGGDRSLFSGHAIFNVAGVFTRWKVRPQTQLFAGYSYTRGSEIEGADGRAQYHNVTLGAVYDLSKRTSVYLLGAYQHACGTTLDAQGRPVAATASVSDKANSHSSDARSQAIVSIGMRQRF
ncbi:porin [Burkholderia ubonensis]|uniref:porin n=1 Tax=Burkholderia ubonensis TaxID=101571 RepID=UPI000759A3EC|nr:porin [Burkholderia ubonensis]KVM12208.1 porin [Burkholderia ubonensis]KVM18495.1 porin [Burkholderia ubonensis]KVM50607.1 porin [Burkholderia ubonensis]KVX54039.1 porin [Burkholderia ubonensis]KVX96018.1 porin [Burkholderia ubonensis]